MTHHAKAHPDGGDTASVGFRFRFSAPSTPLAHHWEACVGSGHAALCLRADWQAQIAEAHRDLGFERVRFHGILSDDVGTLVDVAGKFVYSFHNADLIMDHLLSIGMRPFVELSFMPNALASGDKRVFSYQDNVTPPRALAAFGELCGRLVAHWLSRYGKAELDQWRFEVWNEPNLEAFWTGGQQGYFDLYRATAAAIKEVSPSLQVGGPATARSEWVSELIAFCAQNAVPLDFVTTHIYPTDALGGQGTDTLKQLAASGRDFLQENARGTHDRAAGLPVYYTEWSVTSNPHDPLHDEPYTAAYLIKAVLDVAGLVDGYSYWAFSDIFTENYFPSMPFQGGFGLMTLHGVPKPAYRAFQILHRLGRELLIVEGSHPTVQAWAVRRGDELTVVLVNLALPGAPIQAERVRLRIEGAPAPRRAWVERIDEDHANPRRRWAEWGSPEYLDRRQVDELRACSALTPEAIPWEYAGETIELTVNVPPSAVAALTLELSPRETVQAVEPAAGEAGSDDEMLHGLARESFSYFLFQTDEETGLCADRNTAGAPASIAAIGLALASYPVAAERGFMERSDAARRALVALRFLWNAPQGPEPDAAGHRGFFYHFLTRPRGRRALDCELSTIDTALLVAGGLAAAGYFDRDTMAEREIRALADQLYRRVDWAWALAGQRTVCHGWRPFGGFLPYHWEGYSEALLLYVLGLGSPTHPLPEDSYRAFTETYTWKEPAPGERYLYAGPLFIHQLSHCWLDLRGIRDAAMRERRGEGIDYFENTRRATLAQQRYAIDNPHGFAGYGEHAWGITASDGPGPAVKTVDGRERRFFGYEARGAPSGPDDGTLSPWAVVASLPFAPEIVIPTIKNFTSLALRKHTHHGFCASYNPTFGGDGARGWVAKAHLGLNQGPVVMMIENHRSELLWSLMRRSPCVVDGLRRAGFTGGWLERAR